MATREPTYETTVRSTRWPLTRAAPAMRAALRIGAGLLFMQHGAQKLLGWFGGFGPEGGTAPLISLMGLAGFLELVGGLMIVVGLLTRPVAVLLAIEMLAAFLIAHLPQGGVPMQNGGELPLLYALVWAYLAAAGPGPASVDQALDRRRGSG
ncbi:MAG: DoxX family protein [Gemmatimonadetes bacterium]|nr:DoxX family protein [Gemmatimonadota bacterium]